MENQVEAIRKSKERFEQVTKEPLGVVHRLEPSIREIFEHLEIIATKLADLEKK